MKKRIYPLICAVVFLVGCTSSVQKKATIDRSREKQQEVSNPIEEKPCTKAIRVLPEYYTSGETLTVTLKVQPIAGTTGVILEETLPSSWQITSSVPAWMKYEQGTYKWLVFERDLKEFEIRYEVLVPKEATGRKEFKGVVVTYREKTLPVEGSIFIEEKR